MVKWSVIGALALLLLLLLAGSGVFLQFFGGVGRGLLVHGESAVDGQQRPQQQAGAAEHEHGCRNFRCRQYTPELAAAAGRRPPFRRERLHQ